MPGLKGETTRYWDSALFSSTCGSDQSSSEVRWWIYAIGYAREWLVRAYAKWDETWPTTTHYYPPRSLFIPAIVIITLPDHYSYPRSSLLPSPIIIHTRDRHYYPPRSAVSPSPIYILTFPDPATFPGTFPDLHCHLAQSTLATLAVCCGTVAPRSNDWQITKQPPMWEL